VGVCVNRIGKDRRSYLISKSEADSTKLGTFPLRAAKLSNRRRLPFFDEGDRAPLPAITSCQ